MKTIHQVLLGLLVAMALSFVIVSFGTIQPVLKQPTEITPVPTPEVVYVTIQPTPSHGDTPQSEWTRPTHTTPLSKQDKEAEMDFQMAAMLPILIVGVGTITIIMSALVLR